MYAQKHAQIYDEIICEWLCHTKDEEMSMFCTKCGAELQQDAKFCKKCGAPAPAVKPAQKFMPASEQKANPVLEQKTNPVSEQKINPASEQKTTDAGKNNKNGFLKYLMIGLAVVIVILAVSLGVILVLKGNAKNEEESDQRERESKETEVVATEVLKEHDDLYETEAADADAAVFMETETAEETTESEATGILGDDSTDASAVHKYRIVMEDVTWSEAYIKSMEEKGGYLVHINSQEEMDAILAQIAQEGHEDGIFWIGGMRSATKNEYYWMDTQMNSVGEPLNDASYWLDGEPSLYDDSIGLEECYMNMFYVKSAGRWIWNDTVLDLISAAPGYAGKIGYIIEIE